MKIKICGITNWDDASRCIYYGADALGFIFHKKSPRYISASRVKKIIDQFPPFVTPVGVFVNLKEGAVRDICRHTGIRTLQFHGDEDPKYCARFRGYKVIKAFRLKDEFNIKLINKYKVDAYLFDTYKDDSFGGTGETFAWKLLENHKLEKPVILSGGLRADNIREAVEMVQPSGIDISSSLEAKPGKKSPKLIREFFESLDK